MTTRIPYLIYQFFNLILLLMLISVLLTWIPGVNWSKEPVYSLKKFTDYIFMPFRRLIPPIGMFDVSSIFAFITVMFLQRFFVFLAQYLGF